MKRRSLTFRETKNGHDRTVPMTPALSEALQALPPPDRRRQSRPAGLQRPSRPHARVHPPRPPCGRPRRHVPRSPPRRGQHPHHGRRAATGHHGTARTPRPANDRAVPAPRAGSPARRDGRPRARRGAASAGHRRRGSVGTIWAPGRNTKRGVCRNPAFEMVDDTGLEPVTPGM